LKISRKSGKGVFLTWLGVTSDLVTYLSAAGEWVYYCFAVTPFVDAEYWLFRV